MPKIIKLSSSIEGQAYVNLCNEHRISQGLEPFTYDETTHSMIEPDPKPADRASSTTAKSKPRAGDAPQRKIAQPKSRLHGERLGLQHWLPESKIPPTPSPVLQPPPPRGPQPSIFDAIKNKPQEKFDPNRFLKISSTPAGDSAEDEEVSEDEARDMTESKEKGKKPVDVEAPLSDNTTNADSVVAADIVSTSTPGEKDVVAEVPGSNVLSDKTANAGSIIDASVALQSQSDEKDSATEMPGSTAPSDAAKDPSSIAEASTLSSSSSHEDQAKIRDQHEPEAATGMPQADRDMTDNGGTGAISTNDMETTILSTNVVDQDMAEDNSLPEFLTQIEVFDQDMIDNNETGATSTNDMETTNLSTEVVDEDMADDTNPPEILPLAAEADQAMTDDFETAITSTSDAEETSFPPDVVDQDMAEDPSPTELLPQAFTNPPTAMEALDAQGSLGAADEVPATPGVRFDASNKSLEEVTQDNEQLLAKAAQLERENASFQTQSAHDYERIAELQQLVAKIEAERNRAINQRDQASKNYKIEVNRNEMLKQEKARWDEPRQKERAHHAKTTEELRKFQHLHYDQKNLAIAYSHEADEAKNEVKALQKTVAEKDALLAGADQRFKELEDAMKAAAEDVQKNEEAQLWLDVINRDLDRSFQSSGQDLTPENLVKRFRELEQQQPGQMNRATSNTSLEERGDFGRVLPKNRLSGTRKSSLGDELNRATAEDDERSDDGAGDENDLADLKWAAKYDDTDVKYVNNEDVQDHGVFEPQRDAEALFHEDPPMRSKGTTTASLGDDKTLLSSLLAAEKQLTMATKASKESAERVKALEKELSARPANGHAVGVVAAPAAREKTWWEALLEAPWWVKMVLSLLFLLWATTTIGAAIERQRWVWANTTPEMVRFYASPPTLGGVVDRLVRHGHGFGTHG